MIQTSSGHKPNYYFSSIFEKNIVTCTYTYPKMGVQTVWISVDKVDLHFYLVYVFLFKQYTVLPLFGTPLVLFIYRRTPWGALPPETQVEYKYFFCPSIFYDMFKQDSQLGRGWFIVIIIHSHTRCFNLEMKVNKFNLLK